MSDARAVSADGSVIVGASTTGPLDPLNPLTQAFRWHNGVIEPLGALVPDQGSSGNAVSADGSTVVGESGSFVAPPTEAFRWTPGEGMVGLGFLAENPPPPRQAVSEALGVSGDGSIVVGLSQSDLGREAFRWTQATGLVGLGDLPGGVFFSVISGLSSDGSVLVGAGSPENGFEAIRWTEASGMTPLGRLPGHSNSEAIDVSADGSIIVGGSGGGFGPIAIIWDEANGMRDLKSVLADDYGLDLSDWTLSGLSETASTLWDRRRVGSLSSPSPPPPYCWPVVYSPLRPCADIDRRAGLSRRLLAGAPGRVTMRVLRALVAFRAVKRASAFRSEAALLREGGGPPVPDPL